MTDPDVYETAEKIRRRRVKLVQLTNELTADTKLAVLQLRATGVSYREIGRLLGIAHQWAAQIEELNRADR